MMATSIEERLDMSSRYESDPQFRREIALRPFGGPYQHRLRHISFHFPSFLRKRRGPRAEHRDDMSNEELLWEQTHNDKRWVKKTDIQADPVPDDSSD